MGALISSRPFNLALRLLLGGMFVFAAWDKVANPQAFAIAVRAYKIIPVEYSNVFALTLAWSELIAGAMILIGLFTRKAAGAIFLMLGMFCVAIGLVLVRGMVVDCGCFGSDGSATGPLLIVRNLALMVAAVIVMRYHDGWLAIAPRRYATS